LELNARLSLRIALETLHLFDGATPEAVLSVPFRDASTSRLLAILMQAGVRVLPPFDEPYDDPAWLAPTPLARVESKVLWTNAAAVHGPAILIGLGTLVFSLLGLIAAKSTALAFLAGGSAILATYVRFARPVTVFDDGVEGGWWPRQQRIAFAEVTSLSATPIVWTSASSKAVDARVSLTMRGREGSEIDLTLVTEAQKPIAAAWRAAASGSIRAAERALSSPRASVPWGNGVRVGPSGVAIDAGPEPVLIPWADVSVESTSLGWQRVGRIDGPSVLIAPWDPNAIAGWVTFARHRPA